MAKRKKKKRKGSVLTFFDGLRPETKQGVWAIVFFVVALLLVLAPFNLAGTAGEWVYTGFSFVAGIGYFLLPILLFLLSFSLLTNSEQHLGASRAFGSIVFLGSGLALIDMLAAQGGIIGTYIALPLITLFGNIVAVVVLIALLVISLLIILDIGIPLPQLSGLFTGLLARKKKEEIEDDTIDEALDDEEPLEDEDYEDEAYDDEEDIDEEEPVVRPAGESSKEASFGAVSLASLGRPYTPPPLSLLEKDGRKPDQGDVKANTNIIKRTLQNFGIEVEMDEVSIGPSITQYALKPAEGVRLSKIVSLQTNLELALAAHPVRIEAPIPGKSLVGVEVPNRARASIGLASMLGSKDFQESGKPLLATLGRDVVGATHFANIAKMPHVLIAGATGSGKSVTLHVLITSLIYRNSPAQLKFLMVDPKRVELTAYKGIPHLLTPVITSAKDAILALKWVAKEMDRRYDVLESESVRDIESYHKNVFAPALQKHERKQEKEVDLPEPMPYIVVIIDELADIMSAYPRELEAAIVRIAQMSRAVGIHLIISTQRPSVNVITGLIKANIPARIALNVSSQTDSRTILDTGGAEKLLGQGDLLFLSGEISKPVRIQAPYISETEVKKVVGYLRKEYEDELISSIELTAENAKDSAGIFAGQLSDDNEADDALYDEAREIVIRAKKASTSYLQRKLRIGYARAARLMDMLEEHGIIGPADGSKPREVLLGDNDEKEELYDDDADADEDEDGEERV